MFTGKIARGRYFRGDRQIVNIGEEAEAMVLPLPCHFCQGRATASLLLFNDEEDKVYTVPACNCIRDRMPDSPEDFSEWAAAINMADVPFFRVEPAPVFRFDRAQYLIEQHLGELPVEINGQCVDMTPSEAVIFSYRDTNVVFFVQQGKIMLTQQAENFMDDILEFGPIDMDDADDLAKALVLGSGDVHTKWARELLYNRLRARINRRQNREIKTRLLGSLPAMLSGILGEPGGCDCETCRARRGEDN